MTDRKVSLYSHCFYTAPILSDLLLLWQIAEKNQLNKIKTFREKEAKDKKKISKDMLVTYFLCLSPASTQLSTN